jgi:cell division transport system permease protein
MSSNQNISVAKKSRRIPQDLPFDNDSSSPQFLGWIVAIMVFLASLSLVGSTALQGFVESLAASQNQGFSIELSPAEGGMAQSSTAEIRRQEKVLSLLRKLPGVQRTEVVSQASVDSFANTWFGKREANDASLLKPTLIDVVVKDIKKVDLKSLEFRLEKVAPGTKVLPNRQWHSGLLNVASSALIAAIFMAVLIVFATILAAAFSAHTGLIIYRPIIEILRLVGADNRYIAKQFQRHALWLGLKSGVKGVVLTFFLVVGAFFISQSVDIPAFAQGSRWLWTWAILGLMPFVVAFVMMVAARTTVTWELSKLP